MNEVTKLYENAGVKKINTRQSEIDNGDPRFTGISHSDSNIKYPPFTAEKQLGLIKWLANYDEVCRMEKIRDGWFVEIDMITSELSSTFKEALANLINKIWQDLTEEERTQIKEVLE